MGIPTSDGPDLIIHRLKSDVTMPWTRPIAGFVVGVWFLFVVIPYIFAEDPSTATLTRWTLIALIALLLIFSLPSLVGQERHGAAVGLVVAATVMAAIVWVFTG